MILSGSAQEVGHWVISSIVSASLRLSEASNLRSTIMMKPNSTIRSHELLWLLGLTTPGLQDVPGATEVRYTEIRRNSWAMSVYLGMLWSKLHLIIFILLSFLSSLYGVCIPYPSPNLWNFGVMEICKNLKNNIHFSGRKCKRTISNSMKSNKRTICLT